MQNAALWRQFEGQWVDNAYRLGPLIGVGGFGAVFHADHIVEGRLMRNVAVKLIPPDAESCERQLSELIAATNLRHPDLLSCFHAGSASFPGGKLLYLVMELAGESLQTRLERGAPCSPREAATLMEHLASALICLHQQRRVHRDVKPGNVLRAGDTWKLSDFGSLRVSGATTSHTGLVIGTMRYMPPEAFEGIVSPAWDIWSLGALMIEALTGKPPFAGSAEHEVMYQVLHGSPTGLDALPAPFDDLIRRCLVKDHRARWSAAQLLDALQQHRRVLVDQLQSRADADSDAGRLTEALAALTEALQLDPTNTALPARIAAVQEKLDRSRQVEQDIADAVAARDYQRAHQLLGTLLGTPTPSSPPKPPPRSRKPWIWAAATVTLCAAAAGIVATARKPVPKPAPPPPPPVVAVAKPVEVPPPPKSEPAPQPDPPPDPKAQIAACRTLIDQWNIRKVLDTCANVPMPNAWYYNSLCWEGSLTGYASESGIVDACRRAVRSSPSWQIATAHDSRAVNEALRGQLDAAADDFQAYVDSRKPAVTQDTAHQEKQKADYGLATAGPVGATRAQPDYASMSTVDRRAAFVDQIRTEHNNPITSDVISLLLHEGDSHPAQKLPPSPPRTRKRR